MLINVHAVLRFWFEKKKKKTQINEKRPKIYIYYDMLMYDKYITLWAKQFGSMMRDLRGIFIF